MKTIKFAEDFPKLKDDFFTTIRSYQKEEPKLAETYLIKTPTEEFKAMLVDENFCSIYEIPTDILILDTATSSRAEAIEKLQEFYPYIREDDYVRLLYFARIKPPQHYPGWFWCVKCGVPFRPGKGDIMHMSFAGHPGRGTCRFCAAEEEDSDDK